MRDLPAVRTPPPPASVGRVLVIHPGALGDLVLAFPALGAVRAGFARAHVTLLTDAALSGLARDTGLFDEVAGFDAALAFHGSPAARLRLVGSLAARVRRARPDVVGVMKGSPVYAALAAASGAPWRAGLARGPGRVFLTHPVAIDPNRHHADRYLAVAAALGVDPSRRAATAWGARAAPVPAAVRARAWPLVGIAPGGARNAKQDMASKRWPAARFAALARTILAAHPGAEFVLLGGAGDRAEGDAVLAELPVDRVLDLLGETDVAAARAAIASVDVFVGNDSGLLHVAGTTSTPTVVAFGPTDPRVLAPRTAGARPVWDPVADPPCYDEVTGAHRPCRTPCCIARVSVGRMAAAVESVLADAGRAGTAARGDRSGDPAADAEVRPGA